MGQERGSARLRDALRHPNGTIATRVVTFQRQTYEPFTSTRTQAVPAAAAPTAAPPTTARRVVRRATPATLTGVRGRPTRACALSAENEGPSLVHSTEPEVPHTTTAANNNARLGLIFMTISPLLPFPVRAIFAQPTFL